MAKTIWQSIQDEIRQAPSLRLRLIRNISKNFENRYVVSFYTRRTGYIDDHDSEMLSTLLGGSSVIQNKKILFIVHSQGGDPLAAEKIIKILSEYSDNDYWIIVPGTAKSAATMICFGASKIILSPTSELGPIDLQVVRNNGLIPASSIIDAYDLLLSKGISLKEEQRVEPILQQLQSFDPSEIEMFRQINKLAEDIAVKVLKKCMMPDVSETDIKKVIEIFLNPKKSKTHGRPIYGSDIRKVDKDNYFNIQCFKGTDNIWKIITEYHLRAISHLRVNSFKKQIESVETTLTAPDN